MTMNIWERTMHIWDKGKRRWWHTTDSFTLGDRVLQRLHRLSRPARLGTIRRTTPLSKPWGANRGVPIDRYYIEDFLAENRHDIRGRVLEIRDDQYSNCYGVNVEQRDILDINPTNENATIIADLAAADAIQSDSFDCFILTQTLQLIYDCRVALTHAYRILRPGGVLLVTVPGINRIDMPNPLYQDYWRFTTAMCTRMFEEIFGAGYFTVRSYGNVLPCISFLMGMAYQELSREELDINDPRFPVIIAIRAVKCPHEGMN